MQLFSADATMFFKKILRLFFDIENIEKPPQKVAYLWQLGVFYLCSPDCPKQPKSSFPFCKLFYTIVSSKVSGLTLLIKQAPLNDYLVGSNRYSLFYIYWYVIGIQ